MAACGSGCIGTLRTADSKHLTSSLRKGGWMVARGLKVLSIMVGEAQQQELGVAVHMASAARKQREDRK